MGSDQWAVGSAHHPPEALEEKGKQCLVFTAAGLFTKTSGQAWLEIGVLTLDTLYTIGL